MVQFETYAAPTKVEPRGKPLRDPLDLCLISAASKRGDARGFTAATLMFAPRQDGKADSALGDVKTRSSGLTDGDTIFDTATAENHEIVYTLADTGGCSATQIADALGLVSLITRWASRGRCSSLGLLA